MAIQLTRCAAHVARALVACVLVHGVSWLPTTTCGAQELEDALSGEADFPSSRSLAEELPPGDEELGPDDSEFLDPQAAEFDNEWQELALYEDEHKEHIRPFDWMRKWGFRHSSTEGRFHHEKSIPLHYSSWLNRPWHVDFFGGPMLSGDPDRGRVEQENDMLFGLRFGYDFDYYWGAEWRLGWADPVVQLDSEPQPFEGDFFVTDVSLMYYPWGDTKVRPYFQAGMGATLLDSMYLDNHPQQATLLSTPFGMGVVVAPTRWLSFRLEVVDYLAWGSNGVDTMNNVLFAGGMEWRLGARPNSYWPWRSSRTMW
jgi:hypothetical protein